MRGGGTINADGSGSPGTVVTRARRSGRWMFSHNGIVAGWPESVADLARGLPIEDLVTLDAPTDSALLWALVRHRLRGGAPGVVVVSSEPWDLDDGRWGSVPDRHVVVAGPGSVVLTPLR